MRYLTTKTRQELNTIIEKLNTRGSVSLSERIILNKYASRIHYISSLIKDESLEFT